MSGLAPRVARWKGVPRHVGRPPYRAFAIVSQSTEMDSASRILTSFRASSWNVLMGSCMCSVV